MLVFTTKSEQIAKRLELSNYSISNNKLHAKDKAASLLDLLYIYNIDSEAKIESGVYILSVKTVLVDKLKDTILGIENDITEIENKTISLEVFEQLPNFVKCKYYTDASAVEEIIKLKKNLFSYYEQLNRIDRM